MTRSSGLLLIALGTSMIGTAAADNKSTTEARAKRLFRSGERAFEIGRYATAARAFEQAYALEPLPAIAFSVAQANRLQYFVDNDVRRLSRARKHYRTYTNQVSQGRRRGDAVRFLSEIEPILAKHSGARSSGARDRASTELMVSSNATGASASLDGAKPEAMPLIAKVKPGVHKVRVEAKGYFPEQIEATAVQGRLVALDAALRPRPAQIRLHVVHGGARMSVDGQPWRNVPADVLELPAGRHVIRVARRGHKPWTRTFKLGNGQTVESNVSLDSSGQRKLSYWVLISAGASLATAGIWAALARSSHSKASDLSDTSELRALTRDELEQYDALIDKRDSRKTVTYALAGAGGALLVTGALLYYFDNARPEAPTAKSRITLTPMLQPSGAGMGVATTF